MENETLTTRKTIRTVKCHLCGGNQIYPGPRFENHLINEHGIVFDIEHIINLSLYKEEFGSLPTIEFKSEKVNGTASNDGTKENGVASQTIAQVQTDFDCQKCKSSTIKEDFVSNVIDRRTLRKQVSVPCKKTYKCPICQELFANVYKVKLHLMKSHKDKKTLEDVSKTRKFNQNLKQALRFRKCKLCSTKHRSVDEFTRHINEEHNLKLADYKLKYGKPKLLQLKYRCVFCEKESLESPQQFLNHLKMVHRMSKPDYQKILWKLHQKKIVSPKLVECVLCGVSVENKKEHLQKIHLIAEHLYDQLVEKLEGTVAKEKSEQQIFKCGICERDCLDLKKHLERTHQISEELYDKLLTAKNGSDKKMVKLIPKEGSTAKGNMQTLVSKPSILPSMKGRIVTLTPVSPPSFVTSVKKSDQSGEASHQKPFPGESLTPLLTEMKCFFGCPETFKKDFQIRQHLKIKHATEDVSLMARARKAAEEEIALTKSPGATYKCAICSMTFADFGPFCGHIQTSHEMKWRDYKDEHGRCEVDAPPFECKLCNKIVKFDRNVVHSHLKNIHGINWNSYLEQMRSLRREDIVEATSNNKPQETQEIPKVVEKNASEQSQKNVELVTEKQIPKPPKSDIQDKHNKRCSSCNITFDSRRSFIEHCTIVHNMKFKTKSGQTISAPIVQERLRKEALKRKSETHAIENETKKTKSGFIIEIDNAERDDGSNGVEITQPSTVNETTSQRKTLYTPAGVSKWNQCKYECCFCKWTTMSRSSMTSHLHNTHGIPIQEYKKANYPDIEVETNWFQCRLCSARTKFVKDCIAPHLKMSHGMDIDTYEREIMQPEDWPYEVIPEPSLRSEMRVPNLKASVAITKAPPPLMARPVTVTAPTIVSTISLTNTTSASDDRDKWNRCRYQCCLCNLITIDSRQMRIHIATHHNISIEDYVKQFGSTEIVSKRFQCAICASEMKFCRQNIYAHLKDVHKTTLVDYESKYGVPPDDEDEDDVVVPQDNDLSDIAEPEAEPEPEVELEHQEMWTQASGLSGFMDSGILDDGKKPSRWNRCRFRCAVCHKLSSEKRHIREHIMKVHGLALHEYEAQYGECEIHTEYFFCGICHAEVKHNLKNIALHLNNVHNMTPQQYEEQNGRMPEDDVDIPELDQQDVNFSGSHFLMNDGGDELNVKVSESDSRRSSLPNPPKADIINPRNKFCRPCNKDFNRRQAFVEHCRAVHKLNIRFKKPNESSPTGASFSPSATLSSAVSSPSISGTGHPCTYCGKVFSNRSNRTRHVVLSCDIAKLQRASDPGKNSTPVKPQSKEEDDLYLLPRNQISRTPIKCPFPDCDVIHLRTALMKRHLRDDHNANDVSLNVSENGTDSNPEPAEILIEGDSVLADLDQSDNDLQLDQEAEETEEMNGDHVSDEGDDEAVEAEKKVPPLRVKLPGGFSSPEASPNQKESSKFTCRYCQTFTTTNLHNLSRHKKSCMKKIRRQSKEESSNDETSSVEVAVEFNHDIGSIENDEEI